MDAAASVNRPDDPPHDPIQTSWVDLGQSMEPKHQHASPSPTDATLPKVSQYVEELSDDLRTISLDIHDHPQLRWKEKHAHDVMTEYLRRQEGWKVTPSAYGIETAFVASFEGCAKGPVVTFNAEYGTHKTCQARRFAPEI